MEGPVDCVYVSPGSPAIDLVCGRKIWGISGESCKGILPHMRDLGTFSLASVVDGGGFGRLFGW